MLPQWASELLAHRHKSRITRRLAAGTSSLRAKIIAPFSGIGGAHRHVKTNLALELRKCFGARVAAACALWPCVQESRRLLRMGLLSASVRLIGLSSRGRFVSPSSLFPPPPPGAGLRSFAVGGQLRLRLFCPIGAHAAVLARICLHIGTAHAHRFHLQQAHLTGELQHVLECRGDRPAVTTPEAADRVMVGVGLTGDVAHRHVVPRGPLDGPKACAGDTAPSPYRDSSPRSSPGELPPPLRARHAPYRRPPPIRAGPAATSSGYLDQRLQSARPCHENST